MNLGVLTAKMEADDQLKCERADPSTQTDLTKLSPPRLCYLPSCFTQITFIRLAFGDNLNLTP